jgi:hypothetical protein
MSNHVEAFHNFLAMSRVSEASSTLTSSSIVDVDVVNGAHSPFAVKTKHTSSSPIDPSERSSATTPASMSDE